MMKLAYIGYDRGVLRSHQMLSRTFSEIEYFLVQPERTELNVPFANWPILTNSFCIPAEKELKTGAHLHAFKEIQSQYEYFASELLCETTLKETDIEPTQEKAIMVRSLKEIQDFFFDSNKQKAMIEKVSEGIEEYDFVIFENHQLLAAELKQSSIALFRKAPLNSHLWYSIEFSYELKKPRHGHLPIRSFFLVKDRQTDALVDNWYGCHFKENTLVIQQWVPLNQYQNLDYKKFMQERTRTEVERKLEFISLLDFKKSYVETTAGFSLQAGTAKNNKLSAVMPPFTFWSQAQIDRTIAELMEPKIKKLDKIQTLRGLT